MPDSTESILFKKIIDIDNVREAYLELCTEFEKSAKSSKYFGTDGIKIGELDHLSEKEIAGVRADLANFRPVSPVIKREIPKKTGEKGSFIFTMLLTE